MTENDVKKKQREEEAEKSAAVVKAVHIAYATIFSGDKGKLVLDDLEKFCKTDNTIVAAGPIDPYRVLYKNGKRDVCDAIKRMIKKGNEHG